MKGAIFDIDGTLIDSMEVWSIVTGKMLKDKGAVFTDELMTKIQNMTLPQSCEYIVNYFRFPETAEEIMNEAKKRVTDEYLYNIPLKDGAGKYVRGLYEKGIKIAIATSGFPELGEAALKRLGLWDLLSAKAYSFEIGKDKSNPDIYLLAAERMGVAPQECVVFEDILPGIQGAKKAGMKTVAIYDRSNEYITDRLKEEADRYIVSWNELAYPE